MVTHLVTCTVYVWPGILSPKWLRANNWCCSLFGLASYTELVRIFGFLYICVFKMAVYHTRNYPLPGTWIFGNLEQFLYNGEFCFPVFEEYLRVQEPERYKYLDSFMRYCCFGNYMAVPDTVVLDFDEGKASWEKDRSLLESF
jgi:hypothetical protein